MANGIKQKNYSIKWLKRRTADCETDVFEAANKVDDQINYLTETAKDLNNKNINWRLRILQRKS